MIWRLVNRWRHVLAELFVMHCRPLAWQAAALPRAAVNTVLASDTLQAWLTPLDRSRSERGRQVKVHKGFHASWRLNGMRDKVTDMIQSEICPDAAAARRMRVLFTGKPVLCLCRQSTRVLPAIKCKHRMANLGPIRSLGHICHCARAHYIAKTALLPLMQLGALCALQEHEHTQLCALMPCKMVGRHKPLHGIVRELALLLPCSTQHSLGGHAVLHWVSRPTMGCRAWHSVMDVPSLPLHCIAGHSLGGALAVLAAWDLALLFPWASVKVYTVGAPRPGNHAFAKVAVHLPRQLPSWASLKRCLCRAA